MHFLAPLGMIKWHPMKIESLSPLQKRDFLEMAPILYKIKLVYLIIPIMPIKLDEIFF